MLPRSTEVHKAQISGTQHRDHCSILISWSLPCFLVIDPVLVWRGCCGALIQTFLWPLGNFFTTAGICQARHKYECAPGALTNHASLAWSTKNHCLPEIGSQVLPLQNRDGDISNPVVFSNLSSDTHKSKDKTDKHWALLYNSNECFLIRGMNQIYGKC